MSRRTNAPPAPAATLSAPPPPPPPHADSAHLPPKRPGARWSDAQWAGIATTGRSLLVSAAAGSGKTAVLAERCAYLVCEAPGKCDVDELLVVTFTEAAATEMKSRIEGALFKAIDQANHDQGGDGDDETRIRLARQLALIDRASVSTLHGFCARLIRQHFHRLELDPAFSVIDADEAALLRTEIARELFEQRYEGPDSEAFHALIDAYGDGNDERLIKQILKTHDLLGSVIDPHEWLAIARQRIADAATGDFRASALGQELYAEIERGIAAMRASCAGAIATLSSMNGFDKYVANLHNCAAIIDGWAEELNRSGIDAVAASIGTIDLGRLPSVPNVTPDKDVAKSLIDDVRDEMKGGDLKKILAFSTQQWRDGLAAVTPHANVFLDLVEEFGRRYARGKAAMRGVDFTDLERLTLRALRDPSSNALVPSAVAQMLHRQFAHVLVDEYQDINEVQDTILSLASQRRNMFCVGDVKQSIYRFRLAEPRLFLGKQETFRRTTREADGQVIDLQANFRSRAPLLKAMNDVFSRLMTAETADITYDNTHELIPGADYPADGDTACFAGAPIELHLLPAKLDDGADDDVEPIQTSCRDSDEDIDARPDAAGSAEPDRTQREAILIAQRIAELIKTKKVVERDKQTNQYISRPIQYGDIVILLRSMKFKGEDYATILRESGIPVHSESSTGYFESMEVNDILALLKVLDNRAQDIPLAAVLRSPIAGLPDPEDSLARIRLAYPSRSIAFHDAVSRYAHDGTHDDELAAKLRDILEQLDRWRTMAQRRPLAELIWDVYDSTGYLAFCAGLRDGEQRKANLIDLHDRARQFGSFQRQGLARFLAFLDQLRDESDLGQPPVVSEGENVVRIMTIHHSKGLEFPVVFLPDLGKKINLQDCSGSILIDRHGYLGMEVVDDQRQVRYPSLASTLVGARLRKQSMAEELRVLYVAMTRAKEHLICIGTGKPTLPETWEARWAKHVGPLPSDVVVGANTMLDWLGPVAAATRIARGEPLKIIPHTVEEVRGWPTPESLRPTEGERQQRLARLDPLDPRPSTDPAADEIITRLTTPYRFERFSKIAAVEAATALTKKGKSAAIVSSARRGPRIDRTLEFTKTLELPRAVRTELKPSAADVGQATHLVLQHLDFARPCDIADLRAQLVQLVNKRLIASAAAQSVDLDSIRWLIGSPVGELLRAHAKATRRELPIYLALPPHEIDAAARSDDPQDRVMVRSRADALVQTARGLEVVDYKTDRIDDDQILAERVEFYRSQMDLYRRAIKAVTGSPVAAVHLVFLDARKIVTL